MAQRIPRGHEADGRERSDCPMISEPCLGENPDVRMTKWDGKRPFTDLEPDLPVQVRDTALNNILCVGSIRKSELHSEFLADLKTKGGGKLPLTVIKADSIPKTKSQLQNKYKEFVAELRMGNIGYFAKHEPGDSILKRQRSGEVYVRKIATTCSFYARGECTRGANCQYWHETGELLKQKPRVSYFVVNDQEDESIKTLYVGGLNSRVLEQDIRDHFHGYGEIESIRILAEKACAIVKYTSREGAEKAAQELRNKLVVVNGQRLELARGGPQVPKTYSDVYGEVSRWSKL